MVQQKVVIFNEIPQGIPEPGKALKVMEEEIDLDASLPSGSVLVKVKALSLDPYMRGRMRDASKESYVPAFDLGKPIQNFGVAEVVKSENEKVLKGAHLYGHFEFKEYSVLPKEQAEQYRVLNNKEGLPWTTWVGAAGMPGQTAWWGINQIGKPQKGETVFVSGASGPVGQMSIALAHLAGAKVIASAGSDEKVAYLRDELKVEVAFNYKKEKTQEVLEKYKKEQGGFQCFVDNVAGPTLEAVLNTIEKRGRIVSIGAINDYNGEPYGIKNIFQIVAKELKVEGFIILNHDISPFYDEIPKLIGEGKVPKPKEHIDVGLDSVPQAFKALFTGDNFGKAAISLE
ncbi:hypothetical protein JCM8547_006145 [Rhodosporidiobolus lusitaniae]